MRSVTWASLSALALLGSGCESRLGGIFAPTDQAGSGGRDRRTDTLIVGRATDAIGLDPARRTDNESIETSEQIYEHLVRYKPDSTEVEPALATHWEVRDNGTVWTFHLRRGVKFHDGTLLDADAVVFSFNRQRDPFHAYNTGDFAYWESYKNIERVTAVDEHTVEIEIERPYAPFLASLAMFPVSIVSPTAVKAHGDDYQFHPVGTGPFRLVSWSRGDRIVLERFADYWGPPPRLRRLVYRTIPDARQRLIALESGAVDVAYSILPQELQFVELHPDLKLHEIPAQNVAYLALNMSRAPFDDLAMRYAANHAVNKEPIVKLVYQGLGVPAKGPIPPSLWSYKEDIQDYPYDPARARAYVQDAVERGAFDPKTKLKLYAPRTPRGYLPDPERVARAIQNNLSQVGIETELVLQDFASHLRDVQNGKHDLCLLGWSGDNGDPDNFLYMLLDRDNTEPPLARNVAFYKSAELHGLLVYAQETLDRDERVKYYQRAQDIVARDAPWVPLAHTSWAVAAHADVEGLTIHPASLIYYHSVWLRH